MGIRRSWLPAAAILLATLLLGTAPLSAHGHDDLGWAGTVGPVVRRLAGGDRVGTAAAVARDGWSASDRAVLAAGESFGPALVGAHLAARLDVPLLLGGQDVPTDTATALDDLGATSVLGIGDVATPDGLPVRRIGQGPFNSLDALAELAAQAVIAEPGEPSMPVVLASAAGYADALAAANLAPARLLLTDPETLSGATAEVLEMLDPGTIVVLGGTAAVAQSVTDEILRMGVAVDRVAGADRIETALAAAERAGGTVAVASSQGFADAVSLVGWAARTRSAVLLNPHDELASPVETRLREVDYSDVVLAGGTAALGNFVHRQAEAALLGTPPPGFVSTVRSLTVDERMAMAGVSWHQGCPVALGDLRAVEASHWALDGNVVDDGLLVVHADVAEDVRGVLGHLFDSREPIALLRPIEEFGGDDDQSMAANNSSGFNCRLVAGTTRWSEHAYGLAVDLNPIQNPFIRGDLVDPPAGAEFLDRSDVRPGMLITGGPAVAGFEAIGWSWGGRWQSSKDYQHLSLTGL